MSHLGKPHLTAIHSGNLRELQGLVTQLNQRLAAIEHDLHIGNGQSIQALVQMLMAQPDGTVVKSGVTLKTKP